MHIILIKLNSFGGSTGNLQLQTCWTLLPWILPKREFVEALSQYSFQTMDKWPSFYALLSTGSVLQGICSCKPAEPFFPHYPFGNVSLFMSVFRLWYHWSIHSYLPHKRRGNIFGSVCLSVCLQVNLLLYMQRFFIDQLLLCAKGGGHSGGSLWA